MALKLARLNRTTGLALVTAGIALWTGATAGWPGPRWRVWERNLEQQLLLWRGPRQPPRQVVVVPIDDATLQQAAWFSRSPDRPAWTRGTDTLPWPRAAYGVLSRRLLAAGARAVAINVVFEGSSGKGSADDADMARLLAAQRGRVALAGEMLEPEDSRGAGGLTLVLPEVFLPAIGGPAAVGLTNSLAPVPGEPLRHPDAYAVGLLRGQGVESPPALSTTLLQLAGMPSRQPDARMGLNVYGPEGTFTRLPAWEVLDPQRWRNHALRPAVSGALVVVGPLEGGRHATAFGPLSGVEMLATATANSLQGDGLLPWPEAPLGRALVAMLPLLLAGGVALVRRSLVWRIGVVTAVLALQLAAAVLALNGANRWLPLMAPASGLVVLGLMFGGNAYLLEGRERRRLRRTFERYVAPSVVAEILSDPQAAQGILRGRVLEVTVLFSDLKGFTQLTRQRSAAGESELHVRQLNAYLGAMVEVIAAHGGTIDKFIGDAVMAVFGSPVGRGVQEEADAAVRCALAMGERLAQLNQGWRAEGLEELANGVGLASGPVLAGQIGSPQRLDFTVIGDTVNLASRLEGLTRKLDAAVCMDGATARLVEAAPGFSLRSFGLQEIKGLDATEVFGVTAQG
ncbi:adenylate/guanylate cyclase domain-containing protein [Synechococcus sp. FGCU-3]|nr:adenylate/guanylate cyclase domain-containing protein [Synechococcus sp. FGCU3]